MSPAVHVEEIFLSLQGEGAEVGRPHLFLRLGGCPLRCAYCDTPGTWTAGPQCRVHLADVARLRPNPLGAAALEAELAAVAASHGIAAPALLLAVTGGEPLAQADFLAQWLPQWRGPAMLETAGLWPERLARLLPALDAVSLDWKLRSTLDRGAERIAPAACVALARAAGVRYWVKVVVTAAVAREELAAALGELSELAPGTAVFLQPASVVPGGPAPPPAARLLAWALAFGALDLELRVLPQVHPLLGLR